MVIVCRFNLVEETVKGFVGQVVHQAECLALDFTCAIHKDGWIHEMCIDYRSLNDHQEQVPLALD